MQNIKTLSKRKQGIEYYGNIGAKTPWDFSYIRSEEGKEIFFYPFDISESLKITIIKEILRNEKREYYT